MTRTLAALLSVLALALGPAFGQLPLCPADDGFDPGCCQPAQPHLPQFPTVTSSAAYACINLCLSNALQATVSLSAPQFVLCDYAIANLTVTSPGLVGPNFSGVVVMKYARTWREFPTANTSRQVWRFLINTDVQFANAFGTTANCPTPPCALPPHNLPVHMVGSIDYARDCPGTSTAGWSIALTLTHSIGCFFHAGFSQRPLAGAAKHENTAYVLVAPGNFVFANVMEPAGPVVAESTRSNVISLTPFNYHCFGEAKVLQGHLATPMQDCYTCSPILPIGPSIWKHQTLQAYAGCGPLTVVFPINTVPLAPILPTGLIAMSIGSWVGINPAAFPTGREVSVHLGVLQYDDPCLPNTNQTLHAVTGVGHRSPTPATLFTSSPAAAPVHQFLDLHNMLYVAPSPTGATTLVPGIGALFISNEQWNLNMP